MFKKHIILVSVFIFVLAILAFYRGKKGVNASTVKRVALTVFGLSLFAYMNKTDIIFYMSYSVVIIIASLLEKEKNTAFAEDREKEKENYRILIERYYGFCKSHYTENQKSLVRSHMGCTAGVSDYSKYFDELRKTKDHFLKLLAEEKERYINGEVDDAIAFKYRTSEEKLYNKRIEEIYREFASLIENA